MTARQRDSQVTALIHAAGIQPFLERREDRELSRLVGHGSGCGRARGAPRMEAFLMRLCGHFFAAGALAVVAGTAWGQAAATVLRVAPSADVQELDPTRGRNLIS